MILSIGNASITTSTNEILLEIIIGAELSFDEHVSSLRGEATKKLHALGHIGSFMYFKKR